MSWSPPPHGHCTPWARTARLSLGRKAAVRAGLGSGSSTPSFPWQGCPRWPCPPGCPGWSYSLGLKWRVPRVVTGTWGQLNPILGWRVALSPQNNDTSPWETRHGEKGQVRAPGDTASSIPPLPHTQLFFRSPCWVPAAGKGRCSPAQPFPSPTVLTLGLAGASSCHAEPSSAHTVTGHVLLRLEEDDVELGREEAAEDHGAAEAHRDAHGGGLHLETGLGIRCSTRQPLPRAGQDEALTVALDVVLTGCTLQGHPTPPHTTSHCQGGPSGHPWVERGHCPDGDTLSSSPSPANLLLCGPARGQSLHWPIPVPAPSGHAGSLWKLLTAAASTNSSRPIKDRFGCLCQGV